MYFACVYNGAVCLLYHAAALKIMFYLSLMGQYFMGIANLRRIDIERTSMTRRSWVTTWFQAVMSDSINSHLVVEWLLDISTASLHPEICNRIHALGFGGPVRRPAVALAAPFGD